MTHSESAPFSPQMMDWYLSRLHLSRESADIWRMGLQGELGGVPQPRREFLVGEIRLPADDGGNIYFYGTLGTAEAEFGRTADHEHEFFMMCHSPEHARALVRTVAYARLHHYAAERLGDGHTFRLDDDSALRARGYTNVLVLPADFYLPFRGHRTAHIAGINVRVHSLVLLTEDEWKFKVAQGVDALLERRRSMGRDSLSI